MIFLNFTSRALGTISGVGHQGVFRLLFVNLSAKHSPLLLLTAIIVGVNWIRKLSVGIKTCL